MIKLEIYNDEQRLRHLAMLRLICKGVRNPQTYQITEEVKRIRKS